GKSHVPIRFPSISKTSRLFRVPQDVSTALGGAGALSVSLPGVQSADARHGTGFPPAQTERHPAMAKSPAAARARLDISRLRLRRGRRACKKPARGARVRREALSKRGSETLVMGVLLRKYGKTAAMSAASFTGDSPLFLLDYLLRFLRVVALLAVWRTIL